MDFDRQHIIFNYEERYIAGLPEKMPLSIPGVALSITRRARERCFERFYTLMTCDVDLLTDERMQEVHLYPERLDKLDDLSRKLVNLVAPSVAPSMIGELEDNMDLLARVANEQSR